MNKIMLGLPFLALLSACGGVTPPTLTSLAVTGLSATAQIGLSTPLTVTALDQNGAVFSGTPTFVSSAPQAIAVSSSGVVTIRHLTTSPVTITVTESGKTASLTVTPYGLDVVGGTYVNSTNTAVTGSRFAAAFQTSTGSSVTVDTPVTVTGPASFNNGQPYTFTLLADSTLKNFIAYSSLSRAAVSGSYTATASIAGSTYTSTFSVDATSVLPLPSNVQISQSATGFTASGTLPNGASCTFLNLLNNTPELVRISSCLTKLPYTGVWNTPLPSGTYTGYLAASTYATDEPFPDQFNRAVMALPSLVVP